MKTLALSVLALAKAPPRCDAYVHGRDDHDRLPPTLPWHKNDTPALPPPLPALDVAEPGAPSRLASRRKPFRWTPELTAKQLTQWGEKTRHDQPQAEHPVQMHAHRLMLWVTENHAGELAAPPLACGKPARGMFGFRLEEIYVLMCFELWWKPARWEGSNGVGDHFRRLTKRKKSDPGGYRYFDDNGLRRRLVFYPVPAPASARQPKKKTPEPTPKTAKRQSLKRAA